MYYYQEKNRSHNSLQRKNKIEVFGEGTVWIQPDQAEILIGADTENEDVIKAQEANKVIINKIIQSLLELGIKEEDVQTANYSIYPIYEFLNDKQVLKGYKVNQMLRITVRDINKVGLAIDTGVRSGANNISSISFFVSNPLQAKFAALMMALDNAMLKARLIANHLQVQLNRYPQIIEEQVEQRGIVPFGEAATVKSASATPISPGRQEIKAFVKTVFYFSP